MEIQGTQTVTANDLTFGYLSAGPPDGPLALCLHGFPDSAYTWRHLLPVLGDAGFHAVAPFMRGYAPTGVPADGAYQTGALAADANALHEGLGGGSDAVLIGHDWGAAAAYAAAAAAAPDRWRRVVTLAVPPFAALLSSFFSYDQLKRSFYIFLFQTALAETALNRSFVEGLWRDWSPGYDAAVDVAHAMDCLAAPKNMAAAIGYYRAMLDPSRHFVRYATEQEAAAKMATQPHLYLHGVADGCLGVEQLISPDQYLPVGSEVEIIPDVGHFLHLENPAEINGHVLDWVGRV